MVLQGGGFRVAAGDTAREGLGRAEDVGEDPGDQR